MEHEESLEQRERSTQRDIAPLFDLDGVFTHASSKEVNPQIISFVTNELKARKPIGLATGRAWGWVEREIYQRVKNELGEDVEPLNMLFISCEKGALTIITDNGEITKKGVEGIAVPDELLKKLAELVPDGKGVFIDPEKEHMFTVEMEKVDRAAHPEIAEARGKVIEELLDACNEVLTEWPEYEAEKTAIAMDVQRRGINKEVAGQEYYDFLTFKYEQGLCKHPQEYFIPMFGDSASDAHAAVRLKKLGVNTSFFYVGKGNVDMNSYDNVEIRKPTNGEINDEGTLALLRELHLF